MSEREQEMVHRSLMNSMSDSDRPSVLRSASARLNAHSNEREKEREIVSNLVT